MGSNQPYYQFLESLEDQDLNGMQEDSRMLLLQRQSLESELALSNAKIARIDAELTSVRSILETVSNNFYLLNESSREIISRLRRTIKQLNTKLETPALNPNVSSLTNRSVMTPLNPFTQLTAKEIKNYLICAYSVPILQKCLISRKSEPDAVGSVKPNPMNQLPIPKPELDQNVVPKSRTSQKTTKRSPSSSPSSSTGSSSSGCDSSCSSSSVSQFRNKPLSKSTKTPNSTISRYPHSPITASKQIKNHSPPNHYQNSTSVRHSQGTSQNVRHVSRIVNSSSLKSKSPIRENLNSDNRHRVQYSFGPSRGNSGDHPVSERLSRSTFSQSNCDVSSRMCRVDNDGHTENRHKRYILDESDCRRKVNEGRALHSLSKQSDRLKHTPLCKDTARNSENTTKAETSDQVHKITESAPVIKKSSSTTVDVADQVENVIDSSNLLGAKVENLSSPCNSPKRDSANIRSIEDEHKIPSDDHEFRNLPDKAKTGESCLRTHYDTLSLPGFPIQSTKRRIRKNYPNPPSVNSSPLPQSSIISPTLLVHRPTSLPCDSLSASFCDKDVAQDEGDIDIGQSEVFNAHKFIYEDIPEMATELTIGSQNAEHDAIYNDLHYSDFSRSGQPRTPEELDDDVEELDFGEDMTNDAGNLPTMEHNTIEHVLLNSKVKKGNYIDRDNKLIGVTFRGKIPPDIDEGRTESYREEGEMISDGEEEQDDQAEYSDNSSRGRINVRKSKQEKTNMRNNRPFPTTDNSDHPVNRDHHETGQQQISVITRHPLRRSERIQSHCSSRERSSSIHRPRTPEDDPSLGRGYHAQKRKISVSLEHDRSLRRDLCEDSASRSHISYTPGKSCSQFSAGKRHYMSSSRERSVRSFAKMRDDRISPNQRQSSFRNPMCFVGDRISSSGRMESCEISNRFKSIPSSDIFKRHRSPRELLRVNRQIPLARFKNNSFAPRQSRARR